MGKIEELWSLQVEVPPNVKASNDGKLGRLIGTALANNLAFVTVSGSNKMVERGDRSVLLRSGTLLPDSCHCS